GHSRLLRSLSFGDDDYEGNVIQVLRQIVLRDQQKVDMMENYVSRKFEADVDAEYVSAVPSQRKIAFAPNVFQIPEGAVRTDQVAVMMPFAPNFTPVYEAIKRASSPNYECVRADDIWNHSTFIQDIFSLILLSAVVVVDFTGKNPNVMYETGIAHTLGKHVVPITQSLYDLPSDMQHHRVLQYHPNGEGLRALEQGLGKKLASLGQSNNLPF
ncbi:MAG TPA: hypothetical protein VJU59_42705, partial [Paraburkholderia sp.]|uniref:hypothetical protein n=1 Tax=Paraburkholderia sp. TaxID=1926495 RepID=UPI002B470E86